MLGGGGGGGGGGVGGEALGQGVRVHRMSEETQLTDSRTHEKFKKNLSFAIYSGYFEKKNTKISLNRK